MSGHLVLRVARPEISLRIARRVVVVASVLAIAVVIALCLLTAYGYDAVSPLTVVRAIIGHGSLLDRFIIRDVRLPRVVMGALVGAGLALCGGVFQTMSRNALVSPDILGINAGASLGAVFAIVRNAPYETVPFAAFGGACSVIALLVVLGVRRRFSIGRVLLVGVAVNMLCGILIQFELTRHVAQTNRLITAQNWLSGNIAGATWFQIRLLAVGMAILVPTVICLGRQLNAFQLGDDIAASLGVPSSRLQLSLVGTSALLAAIVVSAVGPIAFVAFVAPHIARRIARTSSAASFPTAIGVGALLVMVADFAAKLVLAPRELPIGFTLTLIGGPYLLYLVIRTERGAGVA